MISVPFSNEELRVKVRVSRVYPQPARPGPAWYPLYSAHVPEVRLTAANGRLSPNDERDLPLFISEGSKAEFRRKVRFLLPKATIVWPTAINF
jgi:hypothetical protein